MDELEQATPILAAALRKLGIPGADERARAILASIGALTRLAIAAAVRSEREACAAICGDMAREAGDAVDAGVGDEEIGEVQQETAAEAAKRIRARGGDDAR